VEVFGNGRLSSALSMMLKTAVNKTATYNNVLEVKQVQCPKASLESSLSVEYNWFAKMWEPIRYNKGST
jgi:hypothetical protein